MVKIVSAKRFNFTCAINENCATQKLGVIPHTWKKWQKSVVQQLHLQRDLLVSKRYRHEHYLTLEYRR